MVITGDPTQVDLPSGQGSGLAEALHILDGVAGIGVARFDERDVVRHPLVAKIVAAYGRADSVAAYGRADGRAAEQPGRRGKKDADGTGK
jgi:phosphate starvation-inducible PhoH-like protein